MGKSNINEYTIDEIKKHNTVGDCWIIIEDNVYDITTFTEDHPGGSECLVNNAGKDCTEYFSFHSNNAKTIKNKYLIGKVKK